MQQDPNLHIPLNAGQQAAYPMYSYQQGPQYGLQQGGGYQHNPQGINPQMYAGYQIMHPIPRGVVTNDNSVVDATNTVAIIESKIHAGFCCYTCLLYYEIVRSGIFIYFALKLGMQEGYTILSVVYLVIMIMACVIAIWAKSSLNPMKQFFAVFSFLIATVLGIISTVFVAIYFYHLAQEKCPYNDDSCDLWGLGTAFSELTAIGATISIILQALFGALLLFEGYKLMKMMMERKVHIRVLLQRA